MPASCPKVSIGLPVYNGQRYLEETLTAFLTQTYDDFEIVVCDNASTDDTPDILREHERLDPRVRVHRNPENIGAAANFTRTFRLSSGKYFKWAAADDLCAPTFLGRCVQALDRDAGVVLAYPRARIIDAEGRAVEPYELKLPTDAEEKWIRFEALLRGHKCYEVFGLIRRDALARTPLMGGYAHGDGVLLTRLALQGRFVEIPEYLFFPRRHAEQSMTMLGDYRKYAVWFNPKLKGKLVFPYCRMHYEFFRSLHMFPLQWYERLRCYRSLARWTYDRLDLIWGDVTHQLRRILRLAP